MIPQDFIDELLARTDIVEIVQQRVTLKKTGQNYSGLCPFHNEKTASFSVSADKQFYYCFGCQASGNALKFVMELDGLDFISAVESLSARVGLEVPRTGEQASPEQTEHRKSIYDMLAQCSEFYKDQLRQHSGRERAITYLKERGLTGEIARDFGLGFAPPGWDNLYTALAKTNHERDLLIESGMVIDNPEEEKTYDRFRDRIMFPIRDVRGRTIAFGGRIIGEGKPKYLNSPETPVFHKGRELYGLFEARKRNRKLEQLMIVEGYMDVVALAQHDINYCVATLGTATSDEHIERMFRMVSKLVFCFDGDMAGTNAAWKALQVALPYMRDGRSAKFLFLPDGEDPDSLVRKEGKDKLELLIERAPHLPDVFFEKLADGIDVESLDGKAHLAQLAMPLITTIPAGVFKQLMIETLSDITGLGSEKLLTAYGHTQARPRRQFEEMPPSPPEDLSRPGAAHRGSPITSHRQSSSELVAGAVSMLLRAPELALQFDADVYEQLAGAEEFDLMLRLIRTISAQNVTSPSVLLAAFHDTPDFERLRQLAEQEPLLDVVDLPAEYTGIINNLIQRLESKSKQELRKSLLAKPFAELSAAEKDLLRDLTGGSPRTRRQV
ncbi:MAG: DNA primase [Pseudomonadales bacterium]